MGGRPPTADNDRRTPDFDATARTARVCRPVRRIEEGYAAPLGARREWCCSGLALTEEASTGYVDIECFWFPLHPSPPVSGVWATR